MQKVIPASEKVGITFYHGFLLERVLKESRYRVTPTATSNISPFSNQWSSNRKKQCNEVSQSNDKAMTFARKGMAFSSRKLRM